MASPAIDAVRHLIRDCASGCYLTSSGEWKETCEEARNFPDPTSALRLCLRHGWSRSELVMLFGDGSVVRSPMFV